MFHFYAPHTTNKHKQNCIYLFIHENGSRIVCKHVFAVSFLRFNNINIKFIPHFLPDHIVLFVNVFFVCFTNNLIHKLRRLNILSIHIFSARRIFYSQNFFLCERGSEE